MSKQPKFREVCSGHLMAMPPLPGDGQTPRGGCRYLITTCQWILVVSQPRTGPRPVSQVKALRCSTWNIPWISMHRKHLRYDERLPFIWTSWAEAVST